jgi:hypothetical protein
MIMDKISKWAELIRPIFPKEAEITVVDHKDLEIRVVWKLLNDPNRPNKRSKLLRIIITEEAISDCHDFEAAGEKLKHIIKQKYLAFNPDHNMSRYNTPAEEWTISTFDIN